MQMRPVELGQCGEGGDDLAVKLDALAGDELKRAAYASLAQGKRRRKRLCIGLVLVAGKRRADGLLQVAVVQGCDAKRPGAGADGDGKPPLCARDQEEQGPGRRLFQRLQNGIRRILVQLVGAIDDDDAPAPLACRIAEKRPEAPHLVNADKPRIALRLFVPGAPEQEKVRVRERRDFAEQGMVAIDGLPRMARVAASKHRAREMISERRLADAFRTDKQPGMVHAAACKRFGKLAHRLAMAEQAIDVARRRESVEAIWLGEWRAGALRGHAHGLRRCSTTSHTSSATMASGWL